MRKCEDTGESDNGIISRLQSTSKSLHHLGNLVQTVLPLSAWLNLNSPKPILFLTVTLGTGQDLPIGRTHDHHMPFFWNRNAENSHAGPTLSRIQVVYLVSPCLYLSRFASPAFVPP